MTETPTGPSQAAAAGPTEPALISGVDVSHDQLLVDWPAVKMGGVAFAFAKATEGVTFVDEQFAANWSGMAAAHLLRAAYHFFTPADDGAAQAEHFLSRVEIGRGDLPPVLDVEVSGGLTPTALTQAIRSWLAMVESRIQRVPIIYTTRRFGTRTSPGRSVNTRSGSLSTVSRHRVCRRDGRSGRSGSIPNRAACLVSADPSI